MDGISPENGVIALPSTPNSYGYALYIIQDATTFKRAVLWRVIKWLLPGGGGLLVYKLLMAQFG